MSAPPLAGQRVVVTRAAAQSAGLIGALAAAGATVESLPLLVVLPPLDRRPLAEAAARLDAYSWIVLSSANTVTALLPLLPAVWPPSLQVAAIGQATARALADHGIAPTLVAERAQAEGLLATLAPRLGPGARVLLPQADDARTTLADGLRDAGAMVDAVVAYRKALPPDAPGRLQAIFGAQPLGWVTFTSPSTVQRFAQLLGDAWEPRRETLRAASIGPVTSAALRAAGVAPAAEASAPADDALVAAIVTVAAAGAPPLRC